MRQCLTLLISIVFFGNVNAQGAENFTREKEFFIRGNTVTIGNTILSKHSKKAFDDPDKVNDEFKMKYVDIDNDETTWSSSSANIVIPTKAKIVYAGLYWSGTYAGERSGKRIKDDKVYHKILNKRAHDFREVQLKINNGNYMSIYGDLIYDGENSKNKVLKSRSPYACKADITEAIKGIKGAEITVANVAATQGQIIGGSSAGWLLYVVYEDQSESEQYISTFTGLEFVNKKPVMIDFGNFKSSENGELQTSITLGALEGDSNLGRDQVSIFDPETETYINLENNVRAPGNFFNSTITRYDDVFISRTPKSKNTLGFDLATVKLPKKLNDAIAKSTGGVKMELKTRSDRFFLFFTAFQTTISKQFFAQNKTITYSNGDKGASGFKSIIVNQKVEIATLDTTTVSKEDYKAPEALNKELAELLEKPSEVIPNVRQGFYVITNVFSKLENAERWRDNLKDKELEAQLFYRESNESYYVFVDSGMNATRLYSTLEEVRKQKSLAKSWMLKINLD